MITLQEFFNKYNDQPLESDGSKPGSETYRQCVDVTKAYFPEVLGIPPMQGVASEYWTNYPKSYFQALPAASKPRIKPGDIVCWSPEIGGTYGHVAVAAGYAELSNFSSFDQNYPIGSICHFQQHNAKGVQGLLRFIPKEDYMKFDLLRVKNDPTVFYRVWPVSGVTSDSILIPLDAEQQAIDGWGADWNSKVQEVDSLIGQGADIRSLTKSNA